MSKGIVLQLQEEAIDESIDIETLLRKAFLVARKLKLKDFEEWISHEQNGYEKSPPDYRLISGEIRAWNPYRGWIPIVMPGKIADVLNTWPIYHPISSISDTYNNKDKSIVYIVPGELSELLNKNTTSFPTKFGFHTSKTELKKIISAVRNKILDWSLLLEENGIIGNGLCFSEAELKSAHDSLVINNYTNNFYSATDNAQIQQGDNGNQQ